MIRSLVIEQIETKFKTDRKIGFAFIYFETKSQNQKSGSQNQKSADRALRALLRQLAAPIEPDDFTSEVRSLYSNFQPAAREPPIEDLLSCIESIRRSYSSTYIILDGLNECDKSQLQLICTKIIPRLSKSFRIFATGQFDPKEIEVFSESPNIEIEARKTDIQKFLKEKLELEQLENQKLEERITREITRIAAKM